MVSAVANRTPVPEIDGLDLAFGNASHLPPMSQIPEEFKRRDNPYAEFVSKWFFGGRTQDDMNHLVAKPGIDRRKAIAAIAAALSSFEPKHEHKQAGCAFLLSEWFVLHDKPQHQPQLSSKNSTDPAKKKQEKLLKKYQRKNRCSEVHNPKYDMCR